MQLVINGVVREAPELGCVAELASWLRLPAFGSAVELNGEGVRLNDHAGTTLKEGDRLEVVRLLGGG